MKPEFPNTISIDSGPETAYEHALDSLLAMWHWMGQDFRMDSFTNSLTSEGFSEEVAQQLITELVDKERIMISDDGIMVRIILPVNDSGHMQ